MTRATVAVVLLLVSAAGAAAQDSDKGKAVYAAHCQSCHGPDASGGQGPPLVSFDAELSEFTTLVRQGVGLMPPFPRSEISDEQITDLHAYLLSLNKGNTAATALKVAAGQKTDRRRSATVQHRLLTCTASISKPGRAQAKLRGALALGANSSRFCVTRLSMAFASAGKLRQRSRSAPLLMCSFLDGLGIQCD